MKTIRQLGRGAFGQVRLCRLDGTGELVAVKLVDLTTLSKQQRRRAIKEAQLLRKLSQHPHIVDCKDVIHNSIQIQQQQQQYQNQQNCYQQQSQNGHGVNPTNSVGSNITEPGSVEGQPINHGVNSNSIVNNQNILQIVLEFAVCGDLHQHCEREGRCTQPKALALLGQLGSALAYCHRMKILHRDLKPANILLFPFGICKLADFGVCFAAASGDDNQNSNGQGTVKGHGGPNSSNTNNTTNMSQGGTNIIRARTVIGTPQYFAPELVNGEVYGPASDIWSLGVCLYECCAFPYKPFEGRNLVQLALRIAKGNWTPLPVDVREKSPIVQQLLEESLLVDDPKGRVRARRLVEKLEVVFREEYKWGGRGENANNNNNNDISNISINNDVQSQGPGIGATNSTEGQGQTSNSSSSATTIATQSQTATTAASSNLATQHTFLDSEWLRNICDWQPVDFNSKKNNNGLNSDDDSDDSSGNLSNNQSSDDIDQLNLSRNISENSWSGAKEVKDTNQTDLRIVIDDNAPKPGLTGKTELNISLNEEGGQGGDDNTMKLSLPGYPGSVGPTIKSNDNLLQQRQDQQVQGAEIESLGLVPGNNDSHSGSQQQSLNIIGKSIIPLNFNASGSESVTTVKGSSPPIPCALAGVDLLPVPEIPPIQQLQNQDNLNDQYSRLSACPLSSIPVIQSNSNSQSQSQIQQNPQSFSSISTLKNYMEHDLQMPGLNQNFQQGVPQQQDSSSMTTSSYHYAQIAPESGSFESGGSMGVVINNCSSNNDTNSIHVSNLKPIRNSISESDQQNSNSYINDQSNSYLNGNLNNSGNTGNNTNSYSSSSSKIVLNPNSSDSASVSNLNYGNQKQNQSQYPAQSPYQQYGDQTSETISNLPMPFPPNNMTGQMTGQTNDNPTLNDLPLPCPNGRSPSPQTLLGLNLNQNNQNLNNTKTLILDPNQDTLLDLQQQQQQQQQAQNQQGTILGLHQGSPDTDFDQATDIGTTTGTFQESKLLNIPNMQSLASLADEVLGEEKEMQNCESQLLMIGSTSQSQNDMNIVGNLNHNDQQVQQGQQQVKLQDLNQVQQNPSLGYQCDQVLVNGYTPQNLDGNNQQDNDLNLGASFRKYIVPNADNSDFNTPPQAPLHQPAYYSEQNLPTPSPFNLGLFQQQQSNQMQNQNHIQNLPPTPNFSGLDYQKVEQDNDYQKPSTFINGSQQQYQHPEFIVSVNNQNLSQQHSQSQSRPPTGGQTQGHAPSQTSGGRKSLSELSVGGLSGKSGRSGISGDRLSGRSGRSGGGGGGGASGGGGGAGNTTNVRSGRLTPNNNGISNSQRCTPRTGGNRGLGQNLGGVQLQPLSSSSASQSTLNSKKSTQSKINQTSKHSLNGVNTTSKASRSNLSGAHTQTTTSKSQKKIKTINTQSSSAVLKKRILFHDGKNLIRIDKSKSKNQTTSAATDMNNNSTAGTATTTVTSTTVGSNTKYFTKRLRNCNNLPSGTPREDAVVSSLRRKRKSTNSSISSNISLTVQNQQQTVVTPTASDSGQTQQPQQNLEFSTLFSKGELAAAAAAASAAGAGASGAGNLNQYNIITSRNRSRARTNSDELELSSLDLGQSGPGGGGGPTPTGSGSQLQYQAMQNQNLSRSAWQTQSQNGGGGGTLLSSADTNLRSSQIYDDSRDNQDFKNRSMRYMVQQNSNSNGNSNSDDDDIDGNDAMGVQLVFEKKQSQYSAMNLLGDNQDSSINTAASSPQDINIQIETPTEVQSLLSNQQQYQFGTNNYHNGIQIQNMNHPNINLDANSNPNRFDTQLMPDILQNSNSHNLSNSNLHYQQLGPDSNLPQWASRPIVPNLDQMTSSKKFNDISNDDHDVLSDADSYSDDFEEADQELCHHVNNNENMNNNINEATTDTKDNKDYVTLTFGSADFGLNSPRHCAVLNIQSGLGDEVFSLTALGEQ